MLPESQVTFFEEQEKHKDTGKESCECECVANEEWDVIVAGSEEGEREWMRREG